MSLDVYLSIEGVNTPRESSGIFVRVDGETREVSREEWDREHPGREPCVVSHWFSDEVYSANITHNLGKMASAAGIYEHLWRPDEIQVSRAHQLIDPLKAGLERLRAEPDKFKALSPLNGWGTYDGLVRFVERYVNACEQYPQATIRVSR